MPSDEEIKAALAKAPPMTEEEKAEQRRSFVYGNCAIDNPDVTRELVDEVAENEHTETAVIVLKSIKSPDGWGDLIQELGLSEKMKDEHFEYGEYASLELVINERLEIVGGRVMKRGR